MSDLTGTFIANTYQNLVQKPDLTKEEYYNGVGQQITVINRDAIGTVKMFYPPNLVLSSYFNNLSGEGLDDWEGWALCDGRIHGSIATPDLRGRFIAGYTYLVPGDTSTNSQRNENAFALLGKAGAGKNTGDYTAEPVIDIDNVPPHKHQYGWFGIEDGFWGAASSLGWPNSAAYPTDTDGTPFIRGNRTNDQMSSNSLDTSNDGDTYAYTSNTLDGTRNFNDQKELKSTPDNFYPAYVALVYVMRVS